MKPFELRAARALLNWSAEELAFSCGGAAQYTQRNEAELFTHGLNKDLKVSWKVEYYYRESMTWAGVDFGVNEQREPTLSLKPWASCVRPFKIRVFPYQREAGSPYPDTTFVRYGWFDPRHTMLKRKKGDPPTPAIVFLPNEPDIYRLVDLDNQSRMDFIIRALNYSTLTYRAPFLKSWKDHKTIEVIYLELETGKASWCDIYLGEFSFNEEARTWLVHKPIEKAIRIETAKMTSSLVSSDLHQLKPQYPSIYSFWEQNALLLETFLSSVNQLPLKVAEEFWSPDYCNRDNSIMAKMKAKFSPVAQDIESEIDDGSLFREPRRSRRE